MDTPDTPHTWDDPQITSVGHQIDDTAQTTKSKTWSIVENYWEFIWFSPILFLVIFTLWAWSAGLFLWSKAAANIQALLKCDWKEAYIRQEWNRIMCYQPWGKAPLEILETKGVNIGIKWWDWEIIKDRNIWSGKAQYEPWWKHQIIVIRWTQEVFRGTYEQYAKQSPRCNMTVTFQWLWKAIWLDLWWFKDWEKKMDACRKAMEAN
jgi:hypothetical protein